MAAYNRRTETLNTIGPIRQTLIAGTIRTNGAVTVIATTQISCNHVATTNRSNTGIYDVTLKSGFPRFVTAPRVWLQALTFSSLVARVTTFSATAGTFTYNILNSSTTVLTDIASDPANFVSFEILAANTGVTG
jgi:hypothetical protein